VGVIEWFAKDQFNRKPMIIDLHTSRYTLKRLCGFFV